MAQQAHPNKMASRYRPVQWTTRPDKVLKAARHISQVSVENQGDTYFAPA